MGLKWLEEKVNANEIEICRADKGGAILIIPPEYLRKKIIEKLDNPELYRKIDGDIRPKLANNLFQLWKYAKSEGFVTAEEAKQVVGITDADNKSTSSKFKFGRTYYSPSLKIHKLQPSELKPGCDIPVRLVTCLQEGVTKRSDVYVAKKWLQDLQYDYCADLVKDSNETLRWLEDANGRKQLTNKPFIPFTFDFESLYDSLDPNLVLKALRVAMDSCRSHWSTVFKDWLIDLVKLSIDASIGEFDGVLFKQQIGLATGGSLIVEIANITVHYVLQHCLYSDKSLMKNIVDIKRFVDDGVGLHCMTKRTFSTWRKTVSSKVSEFGLRIKDSDWNVPEDIHGKVNFLDINFWFDANHQLQTDLYRKPTDARQFLHFTSCHPSYVFSSVVYSCGVRLRRIINDDGRLSDQIDELKCAFRKAGYPVNLLNDILDPIKVLKRDSYAEKPKIVDNDKKVLVISTHGRDHILKKTLQNIEKKTSIQFSYAKKTAPSLKNRLVKSKRASLGHPFGKTKQCKRRNCMLDKLVSNSDHVTGPNGKNIQTAGGQCNTRNVIYHAQCRICDKVYVGKTTQQLNNRVSGHRNKYYFCLKYEGDRLDLDNDDDHILGLHLYFQHNLRDGKGFNESFRFSILERCSPQTLDLKEHLWIHRLRCIKPYGLNSHDPFGIPLTL